MNKIKLSHTTWKKPSLIPQVLNTFLFQRQYLQQNILYYIQKNYCHILEVFTFLNSGVFWQVLFVVRRRREQLKMHTLLFMELKPQCYTRVDHTVLHNPFNHNSLVCVSVCVGREGWTCVHQPLCVCVHMWVCDEHLTAKDLKNCESILLMRVLELGEEGYKTSHPVLSICLSLLLSHLLNSLSLLLHLLSLSLLLSPSVCFFAQWRAPFCCFLSPRIS